MGSGNKMKYSVILLGLGLLIAIMAPPPVGAQAAFPRMQAVSPDTGTIGTVLTVTGENLGKDIVKSVYLTDSKTDWKTEIIEQTPSEIKVKIPDNAKAGRFSLMILTGGSDPKLIEQPVKVTVET